MFLNEQWRPLTCVQHGKVADRVLSGVFLPATRTRCKGYYRSFRSPNYAPCFGLSRTASLIHTGLRITFYIAYSSLEYSTVA
ncbi:hypothetical protein E2C01_064197 [Portunus trituberculatus]|uniref:Uncharacterized protein n=1 Tax=Portunus trituberculatus TaxID=210409 RepID=A0A5B7HN34_PORTR|nr:hypothetical protein [Portunus trituberculatus]